MRMETKGNYVAPYILPWYIFVAIMPIFWMKLLTDRLTRKLYLDLLPIDNVTDIVGCNRHTCFSWSSALFRGLGVMEDSCNRFFFILLWEVLPQSENVFRLKFHVLPSFLNQIQ